MKEDDEYRIIEEPCPTMFGFVEVTPEEVLNELRHEKAKFCETQCEKKDKCPEYIIAEIIGDLSEKLAMKLPKLLISATNKTIKKFKKINYTLSEEGISTVCAAIELSTKKTIATFIMALTEAIEKDFEEKRITNDCPYQKKMNLER